MVIWRTLTPKQIMRVTIILITLLLVSCSSIPLISPYKIDIQQGNYVTQEMVSKLKLGMTKSQVRFVLGTPLVVDSFHTDRWDYLYLYRAQGELTEQRNIVVFFEDNKLARIEGDIVPAAAPQGAENVEKTNDATEAQPAATDKAQEEKSKDEKRATPGRKKKEKGFFGKMLEKVGI
jgi:outer membrane protein assembly factor BamE